MAVDEIGIVLDLCKKIEQKFEEMTRQQQDLTEKLDNKIKETKCLHGQSLARNQSFPLSMTWR
jgi:ABC-type Fe3+-hydroxamate transport system substrate-binding protein